jgi:GT2 family glycosyltransferase
VSAIKAGYKIMYTHESVVYHEIAGSTNAKPSLSVYQNYRNKLYFASKHQGKLNYVVWLSSFILFIILFAPRKGVLDERNDYFKRAFKRAALWAIRDHFKGVFINRKLLDDIESKLQAIYK